MLLVLQPKKPQDSDIDYAALFPSCEVKFHGTNLAVQSVVLDKVILWGDLDAVPRLRS